MTELADLLPSERPDFVAFRRGRVISVAGRSVKVDLGTLEVTVPAADSCYPIPGQTVLLSVEGSTMTAIAALGGVNKQPTMVATSSTATTVTGVVNGVSRVVTKAGEFTVAAGNELPLYWAADGSEVWAGGRAGVPYVPPPPSGGGGGGGGGGGVTSGTATYPATTNAAYIGSARRPITVVPQGVQNGHMLSGIYVYGHGRFRELQGRTITGFRINVGRSSGSGTINFYTHGAAAAPESLPAFSNGPAGRGGSGWLSLPTSMANWLISGSGTGGIGITGDPYVALQGIPSGTLQFDWRK